MSENPTDIGRINQSAIDGELMEWIQLDGLKVQGHPKEAEFEKVSTQAKSILERMSMFAKKALESPELVKQYLENGATAWWSSTADVTAYRAAEEARLGVIIKKAGMKVD